MALTYTIQSKAVMGTRRSNIVRVAIGAAGDYSTGLTLTAASCGVGSIDHVRYLGSSGATTRATWEWDYTNSKLRAYKSNTAALPTECAGTDVNGMTILLEVIGDIANKG